MTSQQPITVPDGTTIQSVQAKSVNIQCTRWDFGGRPDRFATTIEFCGRVPIDLTKRVYILQFEDDEEGDLV